MRRLSLAFGFLFLLSSALVPSGSSSAVTPTNARSRSEHTVVKLTPGKVPQLAAPNRLLVKFRKGVERAKARSFHRAVGARVESRIAGGLGIDVVRLPKGLGLQAAVRRYEASPLVEYAEPDFYRFALSTPDDPSYPDLWGLNNTGQSHPVADPPPPTTTGISGADMNVAEAWDTVKGSSSVVIAVIDSGVDVSHPDLAANIWTNPGEIPSDGLDNDGNGLIDDVNGWDFAENDNSLLEPDSSIEGYDHGTHVAGTIAAVTNNALGVSGICGGDAAASTPGCRIMVLKFMKPVDTDGDDIPDAMGGTLSAELKAIIYARQKGAAIINASFGSYTFSLSERNAFRLAGSASGILSVVAAGNDSLDNDMPILVTDESGNFVASSPGYPASYTVGQILTVAASNDSDEYGYLTGCHRFDGFTKSQCAFTNWGHDSVDVAAPGVDVESTVPGSAYATFDGTSMAAPHVAGLAGLLKAQDSTRSALTIKNMIMNSSRKSGLSLNGTMYTQLFGSPKSGKFTRTSGRVDALAALTGSAANATPLTDGNINGAVTFASPKKGSVAWPRDVNDVYKRRLRSGKTYRFTLVVPSGKDYDLYLYRIGTKEIFQFSKLARVSAHGGSIDETFKYKPATTGTYYIQVSSWFKSGSYILRAVCLTC